MAHRRTYTHIQNRPKSIYQASPSPVHRNSCKPQTTILNSQNHSVPTINHQPPINPQPHSSSSSSHSHSHHHPPHPSSPSDSPSHSPNSSSHPRSLRHPNSPSHSPAPSLSPPKQNYYTSASPRHPTAPLTLRPRDGSESIWRDRGATCRSASP